MRSTGYACAVLASLLAGCSSFSLIGFQKAEESGVKKGDVNVYLLNGVPDPAMEPMAALIRSDPSLEPAMAAACPIPPPPDARPAVPPAAVGLIAATGKLLFDLYMDEKLREIAALKAAASPPAYGARAILPAPKLRAATCAMLVRNDKGADKPGLVALFQLHRDDAQTAFWMTPVYVSARSSVAVTAPGNDKERAPLVQLAFAASTKGVGKTDSGLLSVFPVGEGSVAVARVPLGTASAPRCAKGDKCGTSDLIAYPSGDGIASFSLTVAEIGDVGVDLDVATAELKAVKEAIGPALRDAIKEHYK